MRRDPLEQLEKGIASLRMLLVGVDEYHDPRLRSLRFGVADCEGLASSLRSATCHFRDCQLITHLGVASQPTVTTSGIWESLSQLLAGVTARDTILVYFSGHGVLNPDTSQLYLCLPHTNLDDLSNTALAMHQILQKLQDSGAGKQVVILDACHSGGAIRDRGMAVLEDRVTARSAEPDVSPDFTPRLQEALEQYSSQNARENRHFHALLSCSSGQQSFEIDSLKHGIFTYYLIEGLKGKAADINGVIHVDSLAAYVSDEIQEYLGRSRLQTPVHIKGAAQKVILGTAEPPAIDEHPSGIAGQRHRYRDLVSQTLEREGRLNPESLRQLRTARGILLPADTIKQIEQDVVTEFENFLTAYEQEFLARLQQFVDAAPAIHELRKTYHLQSNILAPREASATRTFQEQQTRYRRTFATAIYQHPSLSNDVQQQLRQLQAELGFAAAVVAALERDALEQLEADKQCYRDTYRTAIYQQPECDRARLQSLQTQLGLGGDLVALIEAEENEICDQHKQEYRQAFSQAIRASNAPVGEALRSLQLALGFHDAAIASIQCEETERCEQHKQQYQQAFAQAIRQQEHLSVEKHHELHQLQEALGLSTEVIEALEAKEIFASEQDKRTYVEAYSTAIHRESPLRPETEELVNQLQERFRLSDALVASLKTEANTTCEQNKQRYLSEFVSAIRQRYPLGASDRYRLSQTQQRLGLSNEIVDMLTRDAIAALDESKKAYRQAVDEYVRENYPLSVEQRHQLNQWQQQYALGDAIAQELEHQVTVALQRDLEHYCDQVVSELLQTYPLSPEAQQRLRLMRQGLRLGEAVVVDVEQRAMAVHAAGDSRRRAHQTYQQAFDRILRQYPLSPQAEFTLTEPDRIYLEQFRAEHDLSAADGATLEQPILQAYRQDLQKYEATLLQVVIRQFPLRDGDREFLQNLANTRRLNPEIVAAIETTLTQKMEQYEQTFREELHRNHHLTNETRQRLQHLQQQLALNDDIITAIENRVNQIYQEKLRQYEQQYNAILESLRQKPGDT